MGFGDSITYFGKSLESSGRQLADSAAQNVLSQIRGQAQSAVNNAVSTGISQLPSALQGVASTVANAALSSLGLGGCIGGSMYCVPEDFNKLRQINKKLVQTEFVQEWNFRLEIEGQPTDFDLYVKDLSYSGFELGTDEEKYGIATYTWPTADQPLRISFTARDNYDLRVASYIHSWAGEVVNNNGTVGVPFGPFGYARKVRIYHVKTSGEEVPLYQNMSYPIQYGECTRSHENPQFMEMPVTMVLFSTLYCK